MGAFYPFGSKEGMLSLFKKKEEEEMKIPTFHLCLASILAGGLRVSATEKSVRKTCLALCLSPRPAACLQSKPVTQKGWGGQHIEHSR